MQTAPDALRIVRFYQLLLIICGLLLAAFVLSVLAVRLLRRLRGLYLRGPRRPTPSDDLWQKHRLPDEDGD